MPAPDSITAPAQGGGANASGRLMSIDALRGFDRFWIIAGDALVYALGRMSGEKGEGFSFIKFLAYQLEHADWAGFRFYDLIFPLFVFIVGVSIVFSLTKELAQGGRPAALKRVVRRVVLLFAIAILYSGGFKSEWPDIRLLGVLNRIALCYGAAAMLFLLFKPKQLVAICAALLLGYWVMMAFVPIRDIRLADEPLAEMATNANNTVAARALTARANPSTVKDSPAIAFARERFHATTNFVTGKFEPGYNLVNHVDFQFLPGKKYDRYYDPEGLLSNLPAVATCLLGVFAGLLIRSRHYCDKWKLIYLVSFGVAAVLLGWMWSIQFPVVKKLWSSSFVLVAGGWSALLLAAFYWVIDVKQWRGWCLPFVWFGSNAITIYLVNTLVGGFRSVAGRFVGGDIRGFFETNVTRGFGDFIVAVVGMLLAFLFLRFLHQRKLFLRL